MTSDHWKGDLIPRQEKSAIGTCMERNARFTMLLHLSRMDEREGARRKNSPPLAGHGADAVRSTDRIVDDGTAGGVRNLVCEPG